MGWTGTNLKKTWLRKQGRGMRPLRYRSGKWFCDGCRREHGPRVDRIETLDGRTLCFRQFCKESWTC